MAKSHQYNYEVAETILNEGTAAAKARVRMDMFVPVHDKNNPQAEIVFRNAYNIYEDSRMEVFLLLQRIKSFKKTN